MFKDLLLNISEKEYRDLKIKSQSDIKSFHSKGAKSLIEEKENKKSSYLNTGSLLDLILLSEKIDFSRNQILEDKELNKLFYFGDKIKMPESGSKIFDVINTIVASYTNEFLVDDIYLNAAKKCLYGQSYKEPTLLKKIHEWDDTINFLYKDKEKQIIPMETFDKIYESVQILKENFLTKPIFDLRNDKNIEYVTQGKMMGEIFKFPMKGMFDLFIINNKKKEIHPFDLKHTYNDDFMFVYKKFMYFIQPEIYLHLLYQIIEGTKYEKYKIMPFKFIVKYYNNPQPVMFKQTKKWSDKAWYGFYDGKNHFKGIAKYISEMKWHIDNEKYNFSSQIYIDNFDTTIPDE